MENTATFKRGDNGSLFRPNPGWVIIKPVEQKEVTDSGLLIPTHINRRDVVGTVVAKGDGAPDAAGRWLDVDLTAGDMVVFSRHAGQGWEKPGTSDVDIMFVPFGGVIARIGTADEVNPDSLDAHLEPELRRVVI